ncbi:MAG: Rnf-Nqr domain containing protein [Candidatus Competibacteraceae bacterium]
MSDIDYRGIVTDGLRGATISSSARCSRCVHCWRHHHGHQRLGMGLASMVVLMASNMLVSACRGMISPEVRIPIFVLLIAALVTLVIWR